MRARRKLAYKNSPEAPQKLAEYFFKFFQYDYHDNVIAGYWAVGSEITIEPILNTLHAKGTVCALPVVIGLGKALLFRRWQPDEELGAGPIKTYQSTDDAALVTPRLVLTPLLAFDKTGHRLGQGGGFYDRTLEKLRRDSKINAVGVAYADQQVEHVPHGSTDMKLDVVITERKILKIG